MIQRTSTSIMCLTLFVSSLFSQDLIISGAMKNVMRNGQLHGVIDLDTIKNKTHLYGLGPIEFLAGEITIVNGKIFTSKISPKGEMTVSEDSKVKASFFVAAYVNRWKKIVLPGTVKSIQDLDTFFLNQNFSRSPFVFRILTSVTEAGFHVVNLPTGTKVASGEDAHKGKRSFTITDSPVEMIGFFSREHKGVFTHHDSNLHVHVMTPDKAQMGHLDFATFTPNTVELWVSD